MARTARDRARRSAPGRKPLGSFRRNLVWSAGLHLVVLGSVGFGLGLDRGADLLPPSAVFVELGMSGPNPTPNLGGAASVPPPPDPPPETAPEESPPPEPAPVEAPEERPGVVRPTVENRDRMPVPDARARRRALRPERPESGLRGRDAAWADSAPLETPRDPSPPRDLDTSSRPTRRPTPGASGTGAGGIGLGGAPGGARFDQDFEYTFYQRQMIARIQENWQQIPVRGEARVVVRFTIDREGAIREAEVETSSGQPLLDRAALRAVVLAAPLPRLPDSFPRDRVGVHLLFTYTQPAAGGAEDDP